MPAPMPADRIVMPAPRVVCMLPVWVRVTAPCLVTAPRILVPTMPAARID